MIRINLLPWRDQERKERLQRFYTACGLVAVLAVAICYLVYAQIVTNVNEEYDINLVLETENAKLDEAVKAISGLQEKLNNLKAKRLLIESLQRDRGEVVEILSDLAAVVPDGVLLTGLRQKERRITLKGLSLSNARVSSLMTNIEATRLLERPQLIETRSRRINKKRVQEFSVHLDIYRKPPESETKQRGRSRRAK